MESTASGSVRGHSLEDCALVVAVSAGSDSTALLHSLYARREALGLSLHVAHFDHNFRPEAADDARFVAQMANDLGLPFITEHAAPMVYQREQGISSFEAAARELRYRFLGRAAESVGAAAVALGHNADDQAETVLMHLIRGAGLDGLRGMDALSVWHSSDGQQRVKLFRPLLAVTKDQLRRYCEERGIAYREDPANQDMRFTRNRVRHQLLPSLREYNPRISQALLRLAQAASQESDFLEEETERVWGQLARTNGDTAMFERASLASLPVALQVRLLRKAYENLVGSGRRLQSSHVDAMMALIGGRSGREVILPFGLRLISTHETLTMGPSIAVVPVPNPLEGEYTLLVPVYGQPAAVTGLSGWIITLEWTDSTAEVPADPLTAILDVDQSDPEIRIRARLRGDRFQPYGMTSERKLQDFLVDRKVPAVERDAIPLLFIGGRLAWVVGHTVAHWAAVRSDSRHVLRVRFKADDR